MKAIAATARQRRCIMRMIPVAIALAGLPGLVACSGRSYSLPHDPFPYVRESPTEYYLYLPSNYTADRDWPLFVGIHAFGGDGTQCLAMWQEYAESEGFVLVCPSLADEDGGWYVNMGSANLLTIIRQVRRECRVQQQFFLAGFSAGAEFVQAYAFNNPGSVKGVAVLSSGNYYEPSSRARDVEFLVVIGDRDHPVGLEGARSFVDLLTQNDNPVEFHVLPRVGHEVTPEALELTVALFNRLYAPLP